MLGDRAGGAEGEPSRQGESTVYGRVGLCRGPWEGVVQEAVGGGCLLESSARYGAQPSWLRAVNSSYFAVDEGRE